MTTGAAAAPGSSDGEPPDQESRWELLLGAAGSISDGGHEWDEDPAAWVRAQRTLGG